MIITTVKKQDLVIGERYFLDKTMDAEGAYIGVNGNRELRCNETSIGFNVFITLKLIGKIDWSWWWVLSPLWIATGLVVIVLLIVGIIFLITNTK